jgi:uncharacterized membrane protein YbhN (UPF0104 family)
MTEAPRTGARRVRFIELGLSLLVLVATVTFVGAKALLSRLHALDAMAVAAGLAVSVVQFSLLAARWWFVALRLGVPLRYGRALAESYLASLLNFVVPFGAFGDALRGFRHADIAATSAGERPLGRAFLAIVLDRASGQIVLWLFVLVAAPGLVRAISWQDSSVSPGLVAGGAIFAVAGVIGAAWAFGARFMGRFRAAAAAGGRMFFSPANLAIHLPLSLALLATHVLEFMIAARALHLELGLGAALRVVPTILAAAGLPSFLGGFGAREAAAAGLYHLTGLEAADGAAISFVYGVMGLVASLPGVLALPWRRR